MSNEKKQSSIEKRWRPQDLIITPPERVGKEETNENEPDTSETGNV